MLQVDTKVKNLMAQKLLLLVALLASLDSGSAGRKRRKRAQHDVPPSPPLSTFRQQAIDHHHRGVLEHARGNMPAAEAAFRKAVVAHASAPDVNETDLAYAYYRLGFVLHEEEERRRQAGDPASGTSTEDEPLAMLRAATALAPRDEDAYYAIGQLMFGRGRHEEAAQSFHTITLAVDPGSARAYWALGEARARSPAYDEFESDPNDPNDPSHSYAIASRLAPSFQPDGTRVRHVAASTPEREAREAREAAQRRETILREMRDGATTLRYAGGAGAQPAR